MTNKRSIPGVCLALFAAILLFHSCAKEPAQTQAQPDAKQKQAVDRDGPVGCNPETVHWTALAPLGAEYQETIEGELEEYFYSCMGSVYCFNLSEIEWVYLGCGQEWQSFVTNQSAVTPQEQQEIIEYYLRIAQANAPSCPNGAKKSVIGMDFKRDFAINSGICRWAKYACCDNRDPF